MNSHNVIHLVKKKSLYILTLVTLLPCIAMQANNNNLYEELNQVLNNQANYIKQKNSEIEKLKVASKIIKSKEDRINLYARISDMYYAYNYDSAMEYTKKMAQYAKECNDIQSIYKANLLRATLYASRGFYSKAQDMINQIDDKQLSQDNKFSYYYALFRLYSYWANYCEKTEFDLEYTNLRNQSLKKAIYYADKNSPIYLSLIAGYNNSIVHNEALAQKYYLKVLQRVSPKERIYASTSYTLAKSYKAQGDIERYEKFLLQAAICDHKNCIKENVALQDLAMFLFNQNPKENLETAEKYIQVSFDDALYYNNRLRIYEISQKLATIVNAYQTKVDRQYKWANISLFTITALFIGVICLAFFIFKQNKKLIISKELLSKNNIQLQNLNEQLHLLNDQLINTNQKREALAKLYIDLCSKYIDRFSRFQILVKRKIKANQTNELLSQMSSSRLSEEETISFMNHFDKAFLNLYPTFINEFNTLLRDDAKMPMSKANTLTTELRIFALIRLGVKESSEIANLLFYSPQTIYNYRHKVKTMAINPESFEEKVTKLCTVIDSNFLTKT